MIIQPLIKRCEQAVLQQYHLAISHFAHRGTAKWLIGSEIKYGGLVHNVRRNKVSPLDSRTPEQLAQGGMIGGDRMLHHGYAKLYAKYLQEFVGRSNLVVVEIGILKGTGLATWCDLFPNARIIGLDIDLDNATGNMANLEMRGAFRHNKPELYEFDQFQDNTLLLGSLLHGQKVDICIDDGLHWKETILATLRSVIPHLADQWIYFIEDNSEISADLKHLFPQYFRASDGEMTVLGSATNES